MLEDVCDNLFNADPYYQQGGDMVRVGGLSYACAPAETVGKRISELKLEGGRVLEAGKSYKMAGWASVQSASAASRSGTRMNVRQQSDRGVVVAAAAPVRQAPLQDKPCRTGSCCSSPTTIRAAL